MQNFDKPACSDPLGKNPGQQADAIFPPLPTLLWIDDYEPGLNLYKAIYEELGYRVCTALRGTDGLQFLTARQADAVIVDYEMPEMDGVAVAKSIKQRWPGMPVIMFSGCLPDRVEEVDAFCDKAGGREELLIAIQTVLKNKQNPYPTLSRGLHSGQLASTASGLSRHGEDTYPGE